MREFARSVAAASPSRSDPGLSFSPGLRSLQPGLFVYLPGLSLSPGLFPSPGPCSSSAAAPIARSRVPHKA
eukprot:CAMPEP_0180051742 /NCGR_PEP_ID=MMETSP0985-20121206/1335_1 /TAXON_ID=483367 /ORGANISM="non described non described, Strain CCMP 2436" /LENGTH=70 /DNA_ID=CAMNT_0021981047 /DNA_START=1309 /DNA_END=1521 /DNA_ORIENTATION=-